MRLQQVLASNLCSGCGLCAAVLGPERARMTLQGEGFLRPEFTAPLSAVADDMLGQICPGAHVALPPPGRPLSADQAVPELGPILTVATGHATDEQLRHQASSGGALSALLVHLLATGRISFVLQVAASPKVPWLNAVVSTESQQGVLEASGSRYAPSAPLERIIACLDRGMRFAVVGKPCDIAALRTYARQDDRVGKLVVAMIAFMCGGIPSAKGVKHLVRTMGAEPEMVQSFRFRGHGWPGRATAVTANGEEHSISYHESWGGVLSKHVQLRCKICADGVGMSADIVFADAWHGDAAGYPLFEEQAGRSLVLGRTPLGVQLINDAVQAKHLEIEPLALGEIAKMQPYQIRRTRLTLSRLAAMRLAGGKATHYSGQSLWRLALRAGLKTNVKSFMGTLLRAVTGRL